MKFVDEATIDVATVNTREPKRDDHLLAALDFTVPDEGVTKLDYRFFANAGTRMVLERVEMYSGTAIPAATP